MACCIKECAITSASERRARRKEEEIHVVFPERKTYGDVGACMEKVGGRRDLACGTALSHNLKRYVILAESSDR